MIYGILYAIFLYYIKKHIIFTIYIILYIV